MRLNILACLFTSIYVGICSIHDVAYCVAVDAGRSPPIIKKKDSNLGIVNNNNLLYLFNNPTLIATTPVVQSFQLGTNVPTTIEEAVIYLKNLYFTQEHNLTVRLTNPKTHIVHFTFHIPQKNQALENSNVWELIEFFAIFDFINETVTIIANGQYAHGAFAPRDRSAFQSFTSEQNKYLVDFITQFNDQL